MAVTRYRCSACGNLTRFDITVSRRSKAFYHYSIGGDLTVEDEQVLAESIDEIACRWCGHGKAVEVLPEGWSPAASADSSAEPAPQEV